MKAKMNRGIINIEDTECRLQIGDVCCALRFKDPEYCASVREYYKGFLTKNEPALTIDVNIVLHQEEINLPNSILMSKTVEGNNFDFHSGLITGTLNLDKKQCTINVKNALLAERSVRIFEQFLFQVYYTLLKQKNPDRGKNNFLVHGCAISREGRGYLFSGPAESGKSTIAKISSDLHYTILNDELVIVNKANGHYMVGSTPFRGDFVENSNERVPLYAIFLIGHGKENIIKKISEREFAARFVREVVYSGTLLSMDRKKALLEMLEFCTDVASEVPFYELRFLPDSRFWDSIDSLKIEGRG
ncbi:MAG: hypothetical protein C4B56_02060 [Candidatus Methanophagaceae archaeon]|nr:MAG: hypothetical protein C4B56_02060 [Methanophagales archaeon]RJS74166.1 MAG: hypothetical protein CW714_02115 [Methanophagales archaeon]